MKYNPDLHHRRSVRLTGYDYSQTGAYFITVCVHNRECIFGEIENGKMILNDFGFIVAGHPNVVGTTKPGRPNVVGIANAVRRQIGKITKNDNPHRPGQKIRRCINGGFQIVRDQTHKRNTQYTR